jgi:hypothetical protein
MMVAFDEKQVAQFRIVDLQVLQAELALSA